MYWYIVFGEVSLPPGQWETHEADIPIFSLASEVVLADGVSRFQVRDQALPLLTYLPRQSYRVMTLMPGVQVYCEDDKWLMLRSTALESEASLLEWLASAIA